MQHRRACGFAATHPGALITHVQREAREFTTLPGGPVLLVPALTLAQRPGMPTVEMTNTSGPGSAAKFHC